MSISDMCVRTDLFPVEVGYYIVKADYFCSGAYYNNVKPFFPVATCMVSGGIDIISVSIIQRSILLDKKISINNSCVCSEPAQCRHV